jgi:hypothetical protein
MSDKLNTAVVLNLPLNVGSNEFGALSVNVNTTFHQVTLPAHFSGRMIALRAFTNNVMVGLSYITGAEVDITAAATAAGTSAKVGATIVAGTLYTAVIPKFDTVRPLYMVFDCGTANTVVEMWAMRERAPIA